MFSLFMAWTGHWTSSLIGGDLSWDGMASIWRHCNDCHYIDTGHINHWQFDHDSDTRVSKWIAWYDMVCKSTPRMLNLWSRRSNETEQVTAPAYVTMRNCGDMAHLTKPYSVNIAEPWQTRRISPQRNKKARITIITMSLESVQPTDFCVEACGT